MTRLRKSGGNTVKRPDSKNSKLGKDSRPIRVMITKVGLDGHDRGVKVVARGLRDAGFEVIYPGLHLTPQAIATAAVQEDVAVVGVSIHSNAHNVLVPEIIRECKKQGLKDALFMVGGIIPDEDIKKLKKVGVGAVFPPGASLGDIAEFIRANAPKRGGSR